MSLADGRTVTVSFERVPDRACASPEALKHYLESSYWSPGSRAEIESRKSLSEGFSTILRVRHGGAVDRLRTPCGSAARPGTAGTCDRPVRELFVMRQLGNAWFGCNAVLTDASMDEPVLALCRSLPRPIASPAFVGGK
jgi:hypothetical protein